MEIYFLFERCISLLKYQYELSNYQTIVKLIINSNTCFIFLLAFGHIMYVKIEKTSIVRNANKSIYKNA